MFSRFGVVLVGLLWQTAPSLVQTEASAQKILYRRDIPKNVARSVPRRARRMFWGTFVPKPGTSPIGIQLYESRSSLTLELWQGNSKSFIRINRVSRLYEDPTFPTSKFSAELYWLDNVQKTIPVLIITQITSGDDNLFPGEYRQIKVVSLPSGWKGKTSVQTFADGDSNAGSDGFSADYDEKGRLKLTTYSVGNTGGTVRDTYAWNGKNFYAIPEKRVIGDLFKEPDK